MKEGKTNSDSQKEESQEHIVNTTKAKYHTIPLKCGILKKKKDTNELICKLNWPTDIENKYSYQMGKVVEGRNKLGVWDLASINGNCDI